MGEEKVNNFWHRRRRELVVALILLVGVGVIAAEALINRPQRPESGSYPWHHNIVATMFWVGEPGDESNDFIHNVSSTWVREWQQAYGGVDDPNDRCDHKPCGFAPKENPFYAALPFNDLTASCQPKDSQSAIYWYKGNTGAGETLLKNRWIEIKNGDKVAYAQIQDAGPFGEDDVGYVFGSNSPAEPRAGLDVSPAVEDALQLNGRAEVSWRFIDAEQVPAGPWTETITRSGPDC